MFTRISRTSRFKGLFPLRNSKRLVYNSSKTRLNSGSILASVAVLLVVSGGALYWYGRHKLTASPPNDLFPLTSTTPLDHIGSPQYASPEIINKAVDEIRIFLQPENIRDDQVDREAHSNSVFATHGANPEDIPQYIVYPTSTQEVSEILKICHKYSVPVVPYGAGTALEGHFYSTRRGITIDTLKMNKVLQVNHEDQDAVVQCGVNWVELNEQLEGYGLLMGCDCGPQAKIGGMVATNALGINATNYGSMNNNVISVTAVLADGTIVKTKQRPRKSSAGYNLTQLFIGSEGTLGIVTEITVKLHILQNFETVVVTQFETIKEATDTVTKLFQSGIKPGAIELLDEHSMHCLNYLGYFSKPWLEVPTIFFKLGGLNKTVVAEHSKELSRIAKSNGAKSIIVAKDDIEGAELFSARKNIFYLMIEYGKNEIDENVRVWVTDIAVPISRLLPVLGEIHNLIVELGLEYVILGHVGDGNFHADIFYTPEQKERCEKVVDKMMKLGLANEGTSLGEHGIGNGKRQYLPRELGQNAVDLMRKVKLAIDPKRILNPDKVFKIDPEDPNP